MLSLIWDGFLIFVGLMLGWIVIPQPAWAQRVYDRIVQWFTSWN